MADPAAPRTWHVERYREGDEAAILALFRDVFGRPRSAAHWSWQFARNPYGGPFATLARRDRDGAVVGIYSVMPMTFNLVGRPVAGCQSVDTAVHPDHRGQHVFEETARDCYAWAASAGIQGIIGFPNPTSYPGLVRSLGWDRVLFPTQYKMHLSIRRELASRTGADWLGRLADQGRGWFVRPALASRHTALTRATGAGVRYDEASAVPAGYESLWNVWRAQEVLSIWKDSAYCRWRYDENPDHAFTYHVLERGGEMVAMAVTTVLDNVTTVCEFQVKHRDVGLGRLLASELCRHGVRHDRSAVSFLGHDVGFFDDAFAGFTRRRAYANVLCTLGFVEGRLKTLLPDADHWTVTYGDGDFV